MASAPAMNTVYLHSHQVTGKTYVGQTQFPHQRDIFHRTNKTRPFSLAIKELGWSNFDHTYIATQSREEAENLEKLWIICLQTTNPEFGYNRRFGGFNGSLPDYVCIAMGKSMTLAKTGIPHPHKGTPRPHLKVCSPNYRRNGWTWPKGRPLTEEHKQAISRGRRKGNK